MGCIDKLKKVMPKPRKLVVSEAQLSKMMPYASRANATDVFAEPLNATMQEFEINTPLRAAAFLAQIAVESGELRYTEEIASGEAYEGRVDLGNTNPGDGTLFKGRGLIQVTGRFNYEAMAEHFNTPVEFLVKHAIEPYWASRTAGWFWNWKNLNVFADDGDIERVSILVNGGRTHLDRRIEYYDRARQILGA